MYVNQHSYFEQFHVVNLKTKIMKKNKKKQENNCKKDPKQTNKTQVE